MRLSAPSAVALPRSMRYAAISAGFAGMLERHVLTPSPPVLAPICREKVTSSMVAVPSCPSGRRMHGRLKM